MCYLFSCKTIFVLTIQSGEFFYSHASACVVKCVLPNCTVNIGEELIRSACVKCWFSAFTSPHAWFSACVPSGCGCMLCESTVHDVL